MKLVHLALLFLMIIYTIFMQGCDIEEPAPYYNSKPEVIPHAILTVDNFDSSEVITGLHTFTCRFDSLNIPIKYVVVYLNNSTTWYLTVKRKSETEYDIVFDPDFFGTGEYTIRFELYPADMGFITTANIPVLNLSFKFRMYNNKYFNTEISKITVNKKPTITWYQTKDPYFTAYKVVRILMDKVTDTLATIIQKSDTVYYDASCPNVSSNTMAGYKIISCSRFATKSSQIAYPNSSFGFYYRGILDIANNCFAMLPDRNIVFASMPNGSHVVTHAKPFGTGTVKHLSYRMQRLHSSMNANRVFGIDALGSAHVFNFSSNLTYRNAVTYETTGTVKGYDCAELFPDILLLTYGVQKSGSYESKQALYNASSNTIIKRFRIITDTEGRLHSSGKEGVLYFSKTGNDTLFEINATDTANITIKTLGTPGIFNKLFPTVDGNIILIKENKIELYNNSMQKLEERSFPSPILSVHALAGKLVVCYNFNSADYIKIEKMDVLTLTSSETYLFNQYNDKFHDALIFNDGTVGITAGNNLYGIRLIELL